MPAALPTRCLDGAAVLDERLERLAADIEAAMAGYDGDWGFGMVDRDCDVELEVRGEWVQYTASAGKIVPVIAALRALDLDTFEAAVPDEPVAMHCHSIAGPLGATGEPVDFAAMETALLLVMTHSCDHEANLINDLVTPEQVVEVLADSGVSDETQFAYRWNQARMPAIDLARVWAALLDGRLLEADVTVYLLELAAGAEVPAGLDTFPARLDLPGWQLGQKAGYCIVCEPYTIVALGAGYLRPVPADVTEERGVALVLMAQTTTLPVADQQRREVFPLVVDYVVGDR